MAALRQFGRVFAYLENHLKGIPVQAYLVGILGLALLWSVITTDATVQRSIGVLFGDAVWNRAVVFVLELIAVGWTSWKIWHPARAERSRSYFVVLWLAGLAMIFGMVGKIPTLPQLELVQQFDLRNLDRQAQAVWQWSAFWTIVVVTLYVFTGPHLGLQAGVSAWLIAVVASSIVVGTLPEADLPPSVLLPIAAVCAAVVYIAAVYGPVEAGRVGSAPAAGSRRDRAGRGPLEVTVNVWSGLAVVLLALALAEFVAYVTLNRQVNKDETFTLQTVDDLDAELRQVDAGIIATDKAARDPSADAVGPFQSLKQSAGGLSERVDAVVNAADLVGIHIVQATATAVTTTPTPVATPTASSDTSVANASNQSAPAPATAVLPSLPADRASGAIARLKKSADALENVLQYGFSGDPARDREALSQFVGKVERTEYATALRDERLARDILAGSEVPTTGVFMWVAAIFAVLVLLPWVLFVLFLLEKRETRTRQMLIDLCLLDGQEPPNRNLEESFGTIRNGGLVDRVLGDAFQRTRKPDLPTIRQVQNAIVQRAFSEQEYLVGLAVLTVIVAAGWYGVFYPGGGAGLATTISHGAGGRQMWSYLLSGLNPITAGFAGAYFWCVYALVRRYLDSDLYPAAFLQCAVQIVLALVLSLMFSIAVPPAAQVTGSAASLLGQTADGAGARLGKLAGTSEPVSTPAPASTAPAAVPSSSDQLLPSTAQTAPSAGPEGVPSAPPVEAITILLAFFAGLSISAGFTALLGLLRSIAAFLHLGAVNPFTDQARLTELEGISIWTEARLMEEGIDNVQAMATAPLHRLVLRTHFTTQRLVDWIDQATLYVHASSWRLASDGGRPDAGPVDRAGGTAAASEMAKDLFSGLRLVGVRTATDLLAATGWLKTATTVQLADVNNRQQALRVALTRCFEMGHAWVPNAIYTVAQASIDSPNWVFIANFRRGARQFLDPRTVAWIVDTNPPCPPEQELVANVVNQAAKAPPVNGDNGHDTAAEAAAKTVPMSVIEQSGPASTDDGRS